VDRRPTHHGFTLLEMLIAVTIITLIMAMMYGSYAATTQSLGRYETRSAGRKRADLVLRLMTRQIRCAFAPRSEPNDRKLTDDSQEPVAASDPVFRGDGEDPHGEFLTFVTTAGSSTGAESDQTLVSTAYRYDIGEGSLSIRQSPRAGRPVSRDAAGWISVLDHVADLKLEFHDGVQWRPKWDDRQSLKLPRAVRIRMTIAEGQSGSYQAETTIPIICRTATAAGNSGPQQASGIL
jgi:prepilin-type N-terminal cleavage/methylation domain-containing protein